MVKNSFRKTACLLLTLSCTMIAGCSSAKIASEAAQQAHETDYAITIRVKTGDEAILLLPQNSASTGYLWVLDPLPAGSPVQQVRHVRYQNEGVAQPYRSSR